MHNIIISFPQYIRNKGVIIIRLPNGYGSVFKLSGKRRKPWTARITSGWTDDGKQKLSYLGYYATKAEAMSALADYNKDPYDVNINEITLAELYEKWSAEHFSKITSSASNTYKRSWKELAPLHNKTIPELKLGTIQKVFDSEERTALTMKKMKTVLSLTFDYAIKYEYIAPEKKNIITSIDISGGKESKKHDRNVFTADEIEILWEHTEDECVRSVLILLYSGLRIGELLNLRKEDVHIEEQYFDIKEAKTKAGVRTVPIADKILPFVVEKLREKGSFLYGTSDTALNYNYFNRNYFSYVKSYGIGEHLIHDTRHTCISMLVERGIDGRIIKQIVGHAGEGVTENVYTHISMDKKLEAINKL